MKSRFSLPGGRFIKHVARCLDTTQILVAGYALYMLAGFALLSLPFAQESRIGILDNLFVAVSAVSTTGLVTVDPGSSYTMFGEIVLAALMQLGGIGYMTVGSFVALSISHKLSRFREKMARTAYSLPEGFDPARFITMVIIFTLTCEAIGATILYFAFAAAGEERPLWSAIFHSISAFCTAGFSLNANSFEDYRANAAVTLTIATLSYFGAVGFIVLSEVWECAILRKRPFRFTTIVILRVTLIFSLVGTTLFFLFEPSIAGFDLWERFLAAFFQVMTATTTVGFNTVPIGALAPAAIVLLYGLMIFGASPSGTGGGLKSTTLAVMIGVMASVLTRRPTIQVMRRELAPDRIYQAAASVAFYFLVLATVLFALLLVQQGSFEEILFEAISAFGTVGLSMGITGSLSDPGKLLIILLMIIGRAGVLTFGLAIAARDNAPAQKGDNELVL